MRKIRVRPSHLCKGQTYTRSREARFEWILLCAGQVRRSPLGHTHERIWSSTVVPNSDSLKCRVPCHRHRIRGVCRLVRVQSDACRLETISLFDLRCRICDSYILRALSLALSAAYNGVAHLDGRSHRRVRSCRRGELSFVGCSLKQPALTSLGACDVPGRDRSPGVRSRVNFGSRTNFKTTTERLAELRRSVLIKLKRQANAGNPYSPVAFAHKSAKAAQGQTDETEDERLSFGRKPG
jgi:hypothetical protein